MFWVFEKDKIKYVLIIYIFYFYFNLNLQNRFSNTLLNCLICVPIFDIISFDNTMFTCY